MKEQLRKEGVPEGNLEEASDLLAGQAITKSGINPEALHDYVGGKPTGLGIYGARLGRRSAMLNWIKEQGLPYGTQAEKIAAQGKYMAHEAMSEKYPRTRAALMGAEPGSREQRGLTITKEFEAPAARNVRSRSQETGQAAGVPAGAGAGAEAAPAGEGSMAQRRAVLAEATREARAAGEHITSDYRSPGHELERHKRRPGMHAEGLAFDTRARTQREAVAAAARQRARFEARGLTEGRDFRFITRKHGTAQHLHTELTPEGSRRFYGGMKGSRDYGGREGLRPGPGQGAPGEAPMPPRREDMEVAAKKRKSVLSPDQQQQEADLMWGPTPEKDWGSREGQRPGPGQSLGDMPDPINPRMTRRQRRSAAEQYFRENPWGPGRGEGEAQPGAEEDATLRI